MELLDIVDLSGEPTGLVKERSAVHRDGDLHRTCHVWLVRHRDTGWEILLQKRGDHKDSHPGCYDISSAGHIPAGVSWIPSALRELWEELGITATAGQLCYAGVRQIRWKDTFYGKPFIDCQVSRVYYMLWDGDLAQLRLQESEVSQVRWIGLEDCIRQVRDGTLRSCIFEEELRILKAALPSA